MRSLDGQDFVRPEHTDIDLCSALLTNDNGIK